MSQCLCFAQGERFAGLVAATGGGSTNAAGPRMRLRLLFEAQGQYAGRLRGGKTCHRAHDVAKGAQVRGEVLIVGRPRTTQLDLAGVVLVAQIAEPA